MAFVQAALASAGNVPDVTRIAIVDPQPAVRAGLTALLRSEPGLVPVGSAGTAEEALELVARAAPDIVLLEPYLGVDDGLQLCRRITAEAAPRVVAYTEAATRRSRSRCASPAPTASSTSRRRRRSCSRRCAPSPAAAPRCRRSRPAQLRAAAARVESDDLALLAMLVDRTPAADVRDTLQLDRRRFTRRVERLLGRLRPRRSTPAPA